MTAVSDQSIMDIAKLPLVEILKLGISGFCFLLAFLGYLMLRKEQDRNTARNKVLVSIRFFLIVSIILGVLVSGSSLVQSYLNSTPDSSGFLDQFKTTYVVDESFYFVDLTKWTPVEDSLRHIASSEVIVNRLDRIRKHNELNEPYTLPFYTTGAKIECMPLLFPNAIQPTFLPRDAPEGKNDIKGYEYVLPIGNQVVGFSTLLQNRFSFWNGFRDPIEEWWISYIKYPTDRVIVFFQFPEDKLCKEMTAKARHGESTSIPIVENPPIVSKDGRYAVWTGRQWKPETRIQFNFKW